MRPIQQNPHNVIQALRAMRRNSQIYNPFEDNNWTISAEYDSAEIVLNFDSEVLELETLGELVKGLESEDDYHSVVVHHLLNNVCTTTIANFRRFLEYVTGTCSKSKFFYADNTAILYRVE
jgi:hypothetical protein